MNALKDVRRLILCGLAIAATTALAVADDAAPAADPGPATTTAAAGDDDWSRPATWNIQNVAQIRDRVMDRVAQAPLDDAARRRVAKLWPEGETDVAAEALLDRVAQTLALVDPRVKDIIAWSDTPAELIDPPHADWLLDETEDIDPLVRKNLRLFVGRALAQRRLFDDSLKYLGDLTPTDVVDPATLLFYQAVGHHRLVELDQSAQALATLVEREDEIPLRYRTIARLLEVDIEGVQPDSLDHIARRMDDVYRRLDLAQTDKTVRMVEDGVVQSLQKMIEELERQQQQQQANAPGGSPQPMAPMPDSFRATQQSNRQVDDKPIGDRSGWGDLPEKAREEAMQQIGRDFPAHYRDVIEQYFRNLAAGEHAAGGD